VEERTLHPERVKARHERYRATHRVSSYRYPEAELRYRQRHPERIKQRSRAWYLANKEKVKARAAKWASENRERRKEIGRKSYHAYPEKARALRDRRRALLASASGCYTAQDVKIQLKLQRNRCYWCGTRLGTDYHIDHVIPLCRGGSNGRENIVISCASCNLRKNKKMPEEFAGRLL
jgi:5-methylcytosine-specific restriction endonuclease McrA